MEIEEFIKEKIFENKNDDEICSEILEKYCDEDLDVDLISEKIIKFKKIKEMKNLLKQKEEKEKKEKELKNKVDSMIQKEIDEKLKTIKIESEKFKQPKFLKEFNSKTGEFQKAIVSSESRKAFNTMFRLISEGDKLNAKAISKEIDQDNGFNYKNLDPTRSDVDESGGYAVPKEVHDQILQMEYEQSAMLSAMYNDSIVYQEKVYPLIGDVSVNYIANQNTEITQSQPTFYEQGIDMHRLGLFSNISNTILRQKGVDITRAFTSAVSSAFATFLDEKIIQGKDNISRPGQAVASGDKVQYGLLYDANTEFLTKTIQASGKGPGSGITIEKLIEMKNALDIRSNINNTKWICNQQVLDHLGFLKAGDNSYIFNGYIEGRTIRPFQIPVLVNKKISNKFTLTTNKANAITALGNNSFLICADLSKVAVGITPIRIDDSQHFKFTTDQTTFRALRSYGQKILMGKQTDTVKNPFGSCVVAVAV